MPSERSSFDEVFRDYCEKILHVMIYDGYSSEQHAHVDWDAVEFATAVLLARHGWTVEEYEEARRVEMEAD